MVGEDQKPRAHLLELIFCASARVCFERLNLTGG